MDFFKQTHIKSRLYYAIFLQKTSYLSVIFHHDVTVVAITNAQYKGGNTVASTRTCKQVNSCIIPIENKRHFLTDILVKQNHDTVFFFLLFKREEPTLLPLLNEVEFLDFSKVRKKFSVLWKQKYLQLRSWNSKPASRTVFLLKTDSSFHFDELLLRYRVKPCLHSSTFNLYFTQLLKLIKYKLNKAGLLGKWGQGKILMDLISLLISFSSLEASIKNSKWTRKKQATRNLTFLLCSCPWATDAMYGCWTAMLPLSLLYTESAWLYENFSLPQWVPRSHQ